MDERPAKENPEPRFTVIRGTGRHESDLLVSLLYDTGVSALILLAERYGLHRVPGLNQDSLILRILNHLTPSEKKEIEQDLIAARFGTQSVDELVEMALYLDEQRNPRSGRPHTNDMSPADAILVEGGPHLWVYTMHGHDVTIDSGHRMIHCDCAYFSFAARRKALCKHLALAFKLIPATYARAALIDLLLAREYGSVDTPEWRFEGPRVA